jgi:hypothetical protein
MLNRLPLVAVCLDALEFARPAAAEIARLLLLARRWQP